MIDDKLETNVPPAKKFTLADLREIVGDEEAKAKLEVESVPGGAKAKGEG